MFILGKYDVMLSLFLQVIKMKVRKCLQSGYCCKKTTCGRADYDYENKRCSALIDNDDGTSACGKYEEILKDPYYVFSPAFGFGCCSPIGNEAREQIKIKMYDGEEQYIDIDMKITINK